MPIQHASFFSTDDSVLFFIAKKIEWRRCHIITCEMERRKKIIRNTRVSNISRLSSSAYLSSIIIIKNLGSLSSNQFYTTMFFFYLFISLQTVQQTFFSVRWVFDSNSKMMPHIFFLIILCLLEDEFFFSFFHISLCDRVIVSLYFAQVCFEGERMQVRSKWEDQQTDSYRLWKFEKKKKKKY